MTNERVAVYIHAADAISRAGLTAQLRSRPEFRVVEDDDRHLADVAVVMAEEADEETGGVLRSIERGGCRRLVLVVTRLDDAELLSAVEAGACAILRRGEASQERLVTAVLAAAAGDGSVPPDLLGRLLAQVGQLQRDVLTPRGLSLRGLCDREVDVIRLVADGFDTGEIAAKLSYSERTVKNVIHHVTTRLQLRNRSHMVAYALRQGLI